jgi:hypothetical protein
MSETPQEPIEGVPDDLVDDVDPNMFETEYRHGVWDREPPPERRDTPPTRTPEQ